MWNNSDHDIGYLKQLSYLLNYDYHILTQECQQIHHSSNEVFVSSFTGFATELIKSLKYDD